MGNVDKEEEVCRLAGRFIMRWALGGEAVWKVHKEGGNWWARSHSASCKGATSEKEGKRPEPPNELPDFNGIHEECQPHSYPREAEVEKA